MVTSKLPGQGKSLDMAPLVRQVESLRDVGAEVEVLEVQGIKRLKYLQTLPTLHRLARNVDIIHGHYAFCGWLARSVLSKPVVCSFMGDDVLGTPDAEGRVNQKGKAIIASSRKLARMLDAVIVKSQEMAEVIAPVPSHVVPNGVDMKSFTCIDKTEARKQLSLDLEKRYVLFPGNPRNPRKGFDLAEKALEIAKNQSYHDLELVVLWGVAPTDVPVYMNACDAMLMASWIEGSPNVVKEAMACNLPVVSVPVGDVEHLFEGVNGYTICPRDPAAMADGLIEQLATQQPADGRDALLQMKLDTSSVALRLLEIYASVLASRKASSTASWEKVAN